MKYADLHVHTHYSDSTLSPEEVVSYASERGLAAIAICDHDSIDGIEPCTKLGLACGVEIIPGIEMTAEKADTEAHLLGYFIDWQKEWFRKKLKEIQESRIERVFRMVEKLKASGIDIDPNEIFAIAGKKGLVGRLHVAQALVKSGRVNSIREVFDKYIGFSKPCYEPYTKFSPKEGIEFILKAGGVPVLAHPGTMGHDEYIAEFVEYGLKGIEAHHTDHKAHVKARYEELAGKLGLIVTGGSDCHGMNKGVVLLGNVRVAYEVVERLRSESERIKKGSDPFWL